jgi:hypothetical protein
MSMYILRGGYEMRIERSSSACSYSKRLAAGLLLAAPLSLSAPGASAQWAPLAASPPPVSAPAVAIPSINSTSQGRAAGPYSPIRPQLFSQDSSHRLLVSNDLGMHCADFDARISSILPPYNVVHAQVLLKGAKPTLLDNSTVDVVYSAASNPSDPALAHAPVLAADGSVFKANFWGNLGGYAPFYPPGVLATFFPSALGRVDIGLPVPDDEMLYLGTGKLQLSQQTMPSVTQLTIDPVTHVPISLVTKPYAANAPQSFKTFETSWPLFTSFAFGYVAHNVDWFAAEGIPLTTFDDIGRENPFPLMRVQARSKTTGATLASLDTVVPVSGETNCKTCHLPAPFGNGYATQRISQPRLPSDDPSWGHVPVWVSEEWAADVNTLRLHDLMHATTLFTGYDAGGKAPTPVVCQTCHYTPALDLAQAGPQDAGGLAQASHESMSRVMHLNHGLLKINGVDLFPTMPAPNDPLRANGAGSAPINAFTQGRLEATCYQCHPGKRTQCLRGAMYNEAGAVCQDCHGQMTQVGDDFSKNKPGGAFIIAADYYKNPNTPRVPWLNEPTCGSCHTGDAVSNLTSAPGAIKSSDNIRLLQAFLSSDPKATPILPTNMRFAEPRVSTGPAAGNPQLFRLSVDQHGGVFCEGCHGATHAEWPVRDANANDNMAAVELQGHAGVVMECATCHSGSLGATLKGPHGMHPVGNNGYSAKWVSAHGDYAESHGTAECKACHGLKGEGTALAKVAVARTGLECERGTLCTGEQKVTIPAGTQVGCGLCHSNPIR